MYKQKNSDLEIIYPFLGEKLIRSVDYIRNIFNQYAYNHLIPESFGIPFDIDNIMNQSIVSVYDDKLNKASYGEVQTIIDNIIEIYMSHQINGKVSKMKYYEVILYLILVEKFFKRIYNKEVYYQAHKMIIEKLKFKILQPGDMIGVVTAQSIGEPLTQFTLNSKYFPFFFIFSFFFFY